MHNPEDRTPVTSFHQSGRKHRQVIGVAPRIDADAPEDRGWDIYVTDGAETSIVGTAYSFDHARREARYLAAIWDQSATRPQIRSAFRAARA